MNGLSVVIPSRTARNVWECVRVIVPADINVIIVDDGINWDELPGEWAWGGRMIVPGIKPFCFSRNVNLGIQAAGDDDVIVLNDDTLLETPGGFSVLQRAAEEHQQYGIISSSCNNVGNPNMHRSSTKTGYGAIHTIQPGYTLRDEPRMVCFTCVLIPRRTINTVGLLDPIFTGYGLDDDDYCLRVRNAGLKIGIHDGCFVDHSKLMSTYRGPANANNAAGDFRPNMRIFIKKWGVDNWGRGRTDSPFADLFPVEVR